MKKYFVNIATVSPGHCQLRCPSCPVSRHRPSTSYMELFTLSSILQKLKLEVDIQKLFLFGYNEPLIHPRFEEYVKVCNSHRLKPCISSNFSVPLTKIIEMSKWELDEVRISCSGFTQGVYEKGHKGGDIERVKTNIAAFMGLKKASVKAHVFWHDYKHNQEEKDMMKQFCEFYKIRFMSVEAQFLGQEYIIPAFANRGATYENMETQGMLLTPLPVAAKRCYKQRKTSCRLIDEQLYINHRGQVIPCCAFYDNEKFEIGDFLSMSLYDLECAKSSAAICKSCTEVGAHLYAMQEWKRLTRWYNNMARIVKFKL